MPRIGDCISKDRARGLIVRALRPNDWPAIEALFGENGACGGCWCMYWRVPRGGRLWEQRKGEANRREFKKLVAADKVYGCLAFVGEEPVGWCCIGPRGDFPRLARVKALQTVWGADTWSVVCFYIRAGWRNAGVASALLKSAVQLARERGARTLEGYPVAPYSGDGRIPAAFAWTGVPRLFGKQKFVNISLPGSSREVVVRRFDRQAGGRVPWAAGPASTP